MSPGTKFPVGWLETELGLFGLQRSPYHSGAGLKLFFSAAQLGSSAGPFAITVGLASRKLAATARNVNLVKRLNMASLLKFGVSDGLEAAGLNKAFVSAR